MSDTTTPTPRLQRCPACYGAGELDWADAYGEPDTHPCSQCHGEGEVLA